MTKKEVMEALKDLPDNAEVNVVVTGTAYEDGKYTTFNKLKAELWLRPVPVYADMENELSAKTGQEDSTAVALIGMYNH
jgi:hypothetical protein